MTEQQAVWFDACWKAYWRKRDKGHAKKYFARHCKTEANFKQIIEAICMQTSEMMRRPMDRIPYFGTWLNGLCFEDEIASKTKLRVIACAKCGDTGVVWTDPESASEASRQEYHFSRCSCPIGLLPGLLTGDAL